MKKKKILVLCVLTTLALGCTGCGENQIPDMTTEQMQEIGEYVGITLMKYDASNRSRLVELTYDEELPTTPESTPKPDAPVGMDPIVDTPVIDRTESKDENVKVETVLKFAEGMHLIFTGQEICEYYPKDGANSYFSINAAEGKKLLVLNFTLQNATEQVQDVDLMTSDVKFKITVNGDYTRRALTTMLENDLSTYIGVLPANQSAEVVLIIEVPNETAGSVTSVELKVENESVAGTIKVL